jgi:hypothetical protein
MKKEQPVEKVYGLIETFDFNELPESEKAFVLEHISIEDYNNMRSTLMDTKALFLKYPGAEAKEKDSKLKKLATYPVELYKIAATILLLMGIGLMFLKVETSKQSKLLAAVDTIFVEKKDTVVLEKRNTIQIVNEKTVYNDSNINQNSKSYKITITETVDYERDCSREICPADMGRLSKLKTKNDCSGDTLLKDFIVSVN